VFLNDFNNCADAPQDLRPGARVPTLGITVAPRVSCDVK